MIRLCDKEIYTINLEEITSDLLEFFFFTDGKKSSGILNVLDESGKEMGFLSYESLAYGPEDCIIKSSITAGIHMWTDARNIFQQYPKLKYIPVYNQRGKLQYFCYEDALSNNWLYEEISRQLYYLLEYPQALVWKNEFPNINAVEIYDMNEFAFLLYYVLIQRNVPVILHGEKWEILGLTSSNTRDFADYEKMRIYAEGTGAVYSKTGENDISKQFLFLKHFFDKSVRLLEMEARSKNNNFFTCRFPDWKQLAYLSIEEEYRIQNDIDGTLGMVLSGTNQIEQFRKVAGISREEFLEKKNEENMHIICKRQEFYGDVQAVRCSEGEHKVWLLGPCIVNGVTVLFDDFLGCYIDRYLKNMGITDYGIYNVGYSTTDIYGFENILRQLPIRKKDIVIDISCDIGFAEELGEKPDLILNDLIDTRGNETWFYNIPIHTNARGNEKTAEEICQKLILPFLQSLNSEDDSYSSRGDLLSVNGRKEVWAYFNKLEETYKIKKFLLGSRRTGSIVMNCNPFTLGHRYLIEESAKKVDKLIVFVVEEDKSFFRFCDRFLMVKNGICDIENVIAVPSGRFVLSHHTLPTYFQKEDHQDVIIDASQDVEIFARYICPLLKIDVRFAGEEPIDKITAQYNRQMERTLPEWGIDFEVIPRKEYGGEVISASAVRNFLKSEDWEAIREITPDTTFKFLREKYPKNFVF